MAARVMYLTRSWPRLSQTFILNEVLALERLGVGLDIWAMTPSREQVRQPQVAQVKAPVSFATPVAGPEDHALVADLEPQRYAAAARFARNHPELSSGYANATAVACFEAAVQLAARKTRLELDGTPVTHLHAHFAHDPALVALLVHRLTGLTFSMTAHARDLYQIPRSSLHARAEAATCVLTCCRANVDFLAAQLGPARWPRCGWSTTAQTSCSSPPDARATTGSSGWSRWGGSSRRRASPTCCRPAPS